MAHGSTRGRARRVGKQVVPRTADVAVTTVRAPLVAEPGDCRRAQCKRRQPGRVTFDRGEADLRVTFERNRQPLAEDTDLLFSKKFLHAANCAPGSTACNRVTPQRSLPRSPRWTTPCRGSGYRRPVHIHRTRLDRGRCDERRGQAKMVPVPSSARCIKPKEPRVDTAPLVSTRRRTPLSASSVPYGSSCGSPWPSTRPTTHRIQPSL